MILNLCSWNLSTFTKRAEQVCFFFSGHFFTCCSVIILYINNFHLLVFFHCMYKHWMSLFSFCLLFCYHLKSIFGRQSLGGRPKQYTGLPNSLSMSMITCKSLFLKFLSFFLFRKTKWKISWERSCLVFHKQLSVS